MELLNNRCLIIAEAGVNHNGRLDLALKLCDEAKKAGADIVKFQTWKTENIITQSVAQADYQTANTGVKESQFDMLKKLELSYNDFKIIKQHCDEIGILFSSTADDTESLDFLIDLGIPFIKIGSGDVGNIPFLKYMGSKRKPIILSTGMSTLDDVKLSLETLKQNGATDIMLLHCTTNYPCPENEVNLNAMLTLKNEFSHPVGYSDHTMGFEIPLAAVALGATVIEKHFTLDRSMDGPDHSASMELTEFSKMVKAIRKIEHSLGSGVKEPTKSEMRIREVVKKRIVAKTAIAKSDIFTENNICVKRNDKGFGAEQWEAIIGKVSTRNYQPDDPIVE